MRRSSHWPLSAPISILTDVERAGVLGAWWNSSRRGAGGGVESGGGAGGEVVEDDADALGFWEIDIDELAHAKSEIVSGAMIRALTLAKSDGRRGRRRD